MDGTKRWTVVLDIDQHDGRAHAVARLYMRHTDRLVGEATVHLDPVDRDVPVVGDELAAARALSQLSHQLLKAAAHDIAIAPPVRARWDSAPAAR
jgi:Domain of unknown function (DUF1876)